MAESGATYSDADIDTIDPVAGRNSGDDLGCSTDPWEGTIPSPGNQDPKLSAYRLRGSQLLLMVVVGVAFDLALQESAGPGIITTLLVWAVACCQLRAMVNPSAVRRGSVVVAMVLGAFLSVRTDPRLITANAWGAVGCLAVASVGRNRLHNCGPLGLLADVVGVGRAFDAHAQRFLHRATSPLTQHRFGNDVAASVARGVLILVPVIFILAALLASADVVFDAALTTAGDEAGVGFGHLLLTTIGVALAGVFALAARWGGASNTAPTVPWQIGRIEALVVLGGLNLLFGAFALSHLRGPQPAEGQSEAELTEAIKSQAREGFFQLLWVAGITLVVLLALRAVASPTCRTSGLVRASAVSAIALTLVVLAVAVRGLDDYVSNNGLTPLRFYSLVVAAWLAAACVLVGARMAGLWPDTAWTMPAVVGSALLTIVALNLLNPEAVIARENLGRDDHAVFWHLDKFSADGLHELASGFHDLPRDQQDEVRLHLCAKLPTKTTPTTWNHAKAQARTSLKQLCPTD